MKVVQAVLVVAGTAVIGYGGWLQLRQSGRTPQALLSLALWFGAGPVLHDLLVAPAVAVAGLAVARLLPAPWRTTVAAGAVTTAAVVLVAIPVLTRPAAAPPNPGLDDRAYLPGLLAFLAVFWVLILAATLRDVARDRRRGRPDRATARPRPVRLGGALVSVCRSPLGEWHDAAPAERYSAKAMWVRPGDTGHTDTSYNLRRCTGVPARTVTAATRPMTPMAGTPQGAGHRSFGCQLFQCWATRSAAWVSHCAYASGYADTCTVCAACVSGMSCHPSTCFNPFRYAIVEYSGSVICSGVPQPEVGRCWNRPSESWSLASPR
ncbi:hypothetical protein JNW88_31160 [Micromonospora sp. ATA32]|nr:hypothetical protein [Micromonospora sp. ATA32]